MADNENFYGMTQEELEALPSIPSYRDQSVTEITQDNRDSLVRLIALAAPGAMKKLYFQASDIFLKWKQERRAQNGDAALGLTDIKAIDETVDQKGVYTLNESYDFFCTSGARIIDGVPYIASTLDWGKLPEIAHALYHAEFEGEAGKYETYNVYGYAGIFRANAEGRMAVAMNRAPIPTLFNMKPKHKTQLEHDLLDKARSRKFGLLYGVSAFAISMARGEYPAMLVSTVQSYLSKRNSAPALLREIFELAVDFDEGLQRLALEPLSGSALMVFTGKDETENCAIYRTRNACVIETTEAGYEKLSQKFSDMANVTVLKSEHICVANHWPDHVAEILGHGYDRIDFPRPRCEAMKAQFDDAAEGMLDIKDGVEVDSTVLFSEYSAATGAMRGMAIDHGEAIGYHSKGNWGPKAPAAD